MLCYGLSKYFRLSVKNTSRSCIIFKLKSNLSCKNVSPFKYFNRPFSTESLDCKENVLDKNEIIITKFLTEIMENFKKGNDFLKNLSLNKKYYNEICQLLLSRSSVYDNLSSIEELNSEESKDKELRSLIEIEKDDYKKQLKDLDNELLLLLLPEEPHDNIDDLVIEIKHGVGGQEAMLFANDLFQMYCKYINYKGWSYDVGELITSDIGGIRTASLLVFGKGAFKRLCFEGGVHRVQRVPSTEKGGRVHTSTVAVAILPQPTEVEVVINDKDLKIDTKRASGAGGQHVNTTDSAVRITHIPSGLVTECQEERSQLKNRLIAIKKLRAKLYEIKLNEEITKMKTRRKLQFGTSGRSEKIRTYNYNQGRITDHRIGYTVHNMELFLGGSELLDKLLTALQNESDYERLVEFISSLETRLTS